MSAQRYWPASATLLDRMLVDDPIYYLKSALLLVRTDPVLAIRDIRDAMRVIELRASMGKPAV